MKIRSFLFNKDSRIRGFITVVAFVVLAVVSPCLAQIGAKRAPSGADERARGLGSVVNRAVAEFMSNPCHVGLSVAVVHGNETSFFNYGSTSRAKTIPPTSNSIYEIGSVTKTFTGALAAKAVADNRMNLDSDFNKYLPQKYPNLYFEGHPITLRSLAAHRSGLPRDLPDTDDLLAHPDFERLPDQILRRDSGYSRDRYLRELHAIRLHSEPGTQEVYSNLGMKVIGFGLEQVYGDSLEAIMQRFILTPLGMHSTGFTLTNGERHRLVHGYSRGGNLMPYHLRNAGAAYGLYSTTADMARYVRWQLRESLPTIHLAHELLYGNPDAGQALIWNVARDRGAKILWHGGGTFGATSQVVLFPEEKDGYVLLSNDTCKGTEDALKNIATQVHDDLTTHQ